MPDRTVAAIGAPENEVFLQALPGFLQDSFFLMARQWQRNRSMRLMKCGESSSGRKCTAIDVDLPKKHAAVCFCCVVKCLQYVYCGS